MTSMMDHSLVNLINYKQKEMRPHWHLVKTYLFVPEFSIYEARRDFYRHTAAHSTQRICLEIREMSTRVFFFQPKVPPAKSFHFNFCCDRYVSYTPLAVVVLFFVTMRAGASEMYLDKEQNHDPKLLKSESNAYWFLRVPRSVAFFSNSARCPDFVIYWPFIVHFFPPESRKKITINFKTLKLSATLHLTDASLIYSL